MVEIYLMRADRLLADNLRALLHEQRAKQKDLAQWCGHSEVWISQILRNERTVSVRDLDRIADFFGLQPYHLFQPGVYGTAERRSGRDRRAGKERRKNAPRVAQETAETVALTHPRGTPLSDIEMALLKHYRRSRPQVRELILLAAGAPQVRLKRQRRSQNETHKSSLKAKSDDVGMISLGMAGAGDGADGAEARGGNRSVPAADLRRPTPVDRPKEPALRAPHRVRGTS